MHDARGEKNDDGDEGFGRNVATASDLPVRWLPRAWAFWGRILLCAPRVVRLGSSGNQSATHCSDSDSARERPTGA